MGVPKYSRAPASAEKIESGRYYEVYRDGDQIYVFWNGTKPTSLGEWWEDLEGEIGSERIETWDEEIEHVMLWYGMESDTVHHDGFSRGGAIAQHFGGIGYGSAKFPKYPPAEGSQSRSADDWFHHDVVPVVNMFSGFLPDMAPNDHPHTMDTDGGVFDTPVQPIIDTKAPLQSKPGTGYSGFACAFVGFPAKTKYDRKRHISHLKYGTKHITPKHSRARKRLFVGDSAMRAPVNDTPMEM